MVLERVKYRQLKVNLLNMGLRPYPSGEIRMGIPRLSYSTKSNCLYGLFARFLNLYIQNHITQRIDDFFR